MSGIRPRHVGIRPASPRRVGFPARSRRRRFESVAAPKCRSRSRTFRLLGGETAQPASPDSHSRHLRGLAPARRRGAARQRNSDKPGACGGRPPKGRTPTPRGQRSRTATARPKKPTSRGPSDSGAKLSPTPTSRGHEPGRDLQMARSPREVGAPAPKTSDQGRDSGVEAKRAGALMPREVGHNPPRCRGSARKGPRRVGNKPPARREKRPQATEKPSQIDPAIHLIPLGIRFQNSPPHPTWRGPACGQLAHTRRGGG